MKQLLPLIGALLASVVLFTGCAHFPTVTNVVPASGKTSGQIIEAAIEVARELKYPPTTKIDKAAGIVVFGGFGNPALGSSAQVRIRDDGSVEVTVQRGSVYVPLKADGRAKEFTDKLAEKLK